MHVSEVDIWRSANLIIKQYGEEAESYAEGLAVTHSERGDPDGEAVWLQILAKIREL